MPLRLWAVAVQYRWAQPGWSLWAVGSTMECDQGRAWVVTLSIQGSVLQAHKVPALYTVSWVTSRASTTGPLLREA